MGLFDFSPGKLNNWFRIYLVLRLDMGLIDVVQSTSDQTYNLNSPMSIGTKPW